MSRRSCACASTRASVDDMSEVNDDRASTGTSGGGPFEHDQYGYFVPGGHPELAPFLILISDHLYLWDETLKRWRERHRDNRSAARALVVNGTERARHAARSAQLVLSLSHADDAMVHAR